MTIQRTDDNIFNFHSGFFGTYENLGIFEDAILNLGKLKIPQYMNYLSQIAFCIELGMKTIIINEDNVLGIHDLKELYKKMPKAFQEMIEKKTNYSNQFIEEFLEKIKNIFKEFRYMNTAYLNHFVEKSFLDTNDHIIVSEVIGHSNFQFIRYSLLEEIVKYYKYLYANIDKKLFFSKDEEKDYDEILKIYFEELKRVQTLPYTIENMS